MSDHKRIEKRETRLLRWESYIRRTRHVAFWLGVLVFALPFVLDITGSLPGSGLSASESTSTLWAGVFFLAVAYETHLKVRHIESIQYHRSIESQRNQPTTASL
jgi:hypothetical protein